jgi:4-hydroxy-2-oxoheptanedioate aldolase
MSMSETRSLRELWDSGDATLGGWLSIPSGFSAELMASYGFDWLCVDTQHGLAGYEQMVTMLQGMSAVGVPGFVRVSTNEPAEIMRALDAGADGVIVPMVNSAEEAARAAAACRYPPVGCRSWGPTRVALHRQDFSPDTSNAAVICAVMIETSDGLAQLDEIAGTPGVDAVFIGPNDLAIALGLPPSFTAADPRHRDAIEQILDACKRHSVVAGISCGTVDAANVWRERGFSMLALASDALLLREACTRWLHALRDEALESADQGRYA